MLMNTRQESFMNFTTEKSKSEYLISDSVAVVVIIFGLLINGFITITNLKDYLDGKKLKPYDQILVSLGLSRFLLLCCYLANYINGIFQLDAYFTDVQRKIFRMALTCLDFSHVWFVMWLCVLYYIKISIFNIPFLLHIKLMIPEIILPIILVSYGISFISGSIYAFNNKENSDIVNFSNLPVNITFRTELEYMLPTYFLGNFFPFIIGSVSNILLIQTIMGHMRHIKNNSTSFSMPNMTAHILAIRFVSLLQVMAMINLIAIIIFFFDSSEVLSKQIICFVCISYPVFQSMVFIAGNSKLNRELQRVLRCGKGCCRMEIFLTSHSVGSKSETVIQQK